MSDEFDTSSPADSGRGSMDLPAGRQGSPPKTAGNDATKAAEYYDQLLRLKAEFDNYRKRVEKEKLEARVWGKQDVIMPLLSLVDVFEQALEQAQKAKDVKQVAVGLEFLHKNFSSFLKSEGLSPIEIVGKAYDPHVAEAVEQ